MSRAGAGRGRAFTFGVFTVIALFFAGVGMVAYSQFMPEPSQSSASPLPEEPVASEPSAPQPEPLSLFVELFEPTFMTVNGPDGELLSTELSFPGGMQAGGVISPTHDQFPSRLEDPGRTTKPGTDQKTVLYVGHSRLNDDGNKFNRLMGLPTPLPKGEFTVVLEGDDGQQIAYGLERVVDIKKSEFGSEQYRYLQDNRPGRIILLTSWVRGTYPPPAMARVVIGCDEAHPGCSEP